MRGKGLTPAQLRINWFTPSTQKMEVTGPYLSLPACIDAVNVGTAYTPEMSYFKAFRALQAYGAYSMQIISQEPDEHGVHNVITLIISAAEGHEVQPGIARAQEPILPAPAPLFEPTSVPELAILAHSINKAAKGPKTLVKRKPVREPNTAAKVAQKGQKEAILAPAQEFTDSMQDTIDNAAIASAENRSKPAFLAPAQEPAKKPAKKAQKGGFGVPELQMYRVEYYTFTQEGRKSETTSVAYLQAVTKKVARDVAREKAAGARIQIIHVEHAPSRKVASKKFVV